MSDDQSTRTERAETERLSSNGDSDSFAYKPGGQKGGKWRSKLNNVSGWKKVALLGGVGGTLIAFIGIVVGLFIFINLFKLNHVRELFIDYEFARFNKNISEEASNLMTEESVLSADSTGHLPAIEPGGVIEKLKGFNPEKVLTELGRSNEVKLIFDKKEHWYNRGTDTFKGIEINGQTIPLEGTTQADKIAFSAQLEANIEDAFPLKNSFFRSRLAATIDELAGIKLSRWDKNGSDYQGIKEDEAQKLAAQQREAELAQQAVDSGSEDLNGLAQQAEDDLKNGATPDQIVADIKNSATFKRYEVINNAGALAWGATMVCIFDGAFVHNFAKVIDARDSQYMRQAALTFTAADQQKQGDTSSGAVQADAQQLDGFENSASYKLATNQPVANTDTQLPLDQQPQSAYGSPQGGFLSALKSVDGVLNAGFKLPFGIPGVGNKVSVCSVLLSPSGQIGIIIGTIIAALTSDGVSEVTLQSFLDTLKTYLDREALTKAARDSVAFLFTTEYLIPSVAKMYAGADITGNASGAALGNQIAVGTDLYANEFARAAGGRPLTNSEVVSLNQQINQDRLADAKHSNIITALFSLGNPQSAASRLLAAIPTSIHGLVQQIHLMAVALLPNHVVKNSLATILEPGSAIAANDTGDPFGIQQWGFTTQEIDQGQTDSSWTVRNNALLVEQYGVDKLSQQYGDCFNQTTGQVIAAQSSECFDSLKSDTMAQRYRKYLMDNQILGDFNCLANSDSSCGYDTSSPPVGAP